MRKALVAEVISLDEFLGERGLSMPVSDYLLDKVRFPHGMTLRQRNRFEKEAEKVEQEYSAKRSAAIMEYRQLVAEGKIQEPSRVDILLRTANGHEDNPATHAARRALAKRGIDWKAEKPGLNDVLADATLRAGEQKETCILKDFEMERG